MLRHLILVLSLTYLIHCQNENEKKNSSDLKPIVLKIQRSIDQATGQQQQNQEVATRSNSKLPTTQKESEQQMKEPLIENKNQQPLLSARQQHILQPQYAPVAFIEPQFQYPGFTYIQGKQPYAR